jgi:hypothetical protein
MAPCPGSGSDRTGTRGAGGGRPNSQMVTISECQWPFLHEEAKAGREVLKLRAELTAGAAPSLPGGKVCR